MDPLIRKARSLAKTLDEKGKKIDLSSAKTPEEKANLNRTIKSIEKAKGHIFKLYEMYQDISDKFETIKENGKQQKDYDIKFNFYCKDIADLLLDIYNKHQKDKRSDNPFRVRIFLTDSNDNLTCEHSYPEFQTETFEKPKNDEDKWAIFYALDQNGESNKQQVMYLKRGQENPKPNPISYDYLGTNEAIIIPLKHGENVGAIVIDAKDQAPLGRLVQWAYSQPVQSFCELLSSDIEYIKMKRELKKQLSNIKHKVQNKNVSIGGFAKYILKHIETILNKPDEVKKILEIIFQESKNIEDILNISKENEGEYINLSHFINANEAKIKKEMHDFDIQFQIQEKLGEKIDRDKFQGWLTEILNNIQKYNDKEQKQLLIKLEKTEQGIVLSFRDNGRGLPKEEIPNILEDHIRGSNVGGVYGTGYGLHNIEREIRELGGEMNISSEEGIFFELQLVFPHDSDSI